MKGQFLLIMFFVSSFSFAQVETNCDDLNLPACCPTLDNYTPIIPAWEDLGCKTQSKASIYPLFPKIIEYKGYIFRELNSCAVQNMDCILAYDFCLPATRQKMRVKITDFSHPFWETNEGKVSKTISLFEFQPSAAAIGSHSTSTILKYPKSVVVSSRFSPYGGSSDTVSFLALLNDRYFISIEIDDKPKTFTQPLQVEKFIIDYINQISL